MNLGLVARILAGYVLFFAFFALVPLPLALLEERKPGIDAVQGFVAAAIIGAIVSVLLWLGGRSKETRGEFYRREGLAAVAFAWLVSAAVGAIPFYWSGATPTGIDAVFEATSGLTTTGASVFSAGKPYYDIAELPRSLLLWRSLLHFLGGLGVILMFLVFLPAMGITGKNLLQGEQTGVSAERAAPRLREQSQVLLRVYLIMILLQTLMLRLFGMDFFEAFCHACATIGTGGFSPRSYSIGEYDSVAIELTCTCCSFLGATNFLLLDEFVRSRFRAPGVLLRDTEFRVFVSHLLGVVLVVSLILHMWGGSVTDVPAAGGRVHDYSSYWTCLREALFNVTTVHSSTGFATADTSTWPHAAQVLIMWCMYVGGCTGATAGGLKVLRLMVLAKLVAHGFRHFLRPKSIERVRVGTEVISPATISAVLSLAILWALCILLGTLVLLLDPRLDLLSALSANATCIGGDGPGFAGMRRLADGSHELLSQDGIHVGAYGGFGLLHGWQKALLTLQMLIGRLEIYPLIALATPSLWRR